MRRSVLRQVAATPLVGLGLSPSVACARDEPPTSSPDASGCRATPANPEGPYYRPHARFTTALAAGLPGTPLTIEGRIHSVDGCGRGLGGAVLDLWQCDHQGRYDHQLFEGPIEPERYRLRGKVRGDSTGLYRFTTIMPAAYGSRPRHIHVKVSAPGHRTLTTQLYFRGDPLAERHRFVRAPLLVDVVDDPTVGARGSFDVALVPA